MKMKKILAACMAGALSLTVLAACGQTGNSGSSSESSTASSDSVDSGAQSLEAIKAAGKLTMYTNAAFPPYEYIADNKPAGVDVDIAQAIADDIGVELEVKDVEFTSVLAAVTSGKGSLGASGLSITEERLKEVDFSIPYVTSVQYIIVPEATEVTVFEDLAGKKIGVQDGTTGNFYVADAVDGYKDDADKDVKGVLQDTGAEYKAYSSAMAAVQDMQTGRLDAVVIDQLPAESIVANNEGLKCIELVYADGTRTEEEYAIAVQKGNTELLEEINKTLERLISEGKIDEFVVNHSA